MAVAVASWLLFIASGVFARFLHYPALTIIGFAGFAGAILGLVFLVRCPRCGGILGGFPLSFGKMRVNFCPYCGVSLDEQL
jgi:hypothetical protein